MDKILTISIAAYNVENYISKTLDSLIDESIINNLEIFVVDDGGTDRTLEIAKEYAERYPQSIFPIHKENGGYGSTINTSIELATGKYFKQLDGDDWYQTENLVKLVNNLKYLNVDCVLSYYYIYNEQTDNYLCKKDFSCLSEGEYKIESLKVKERFSIKNATYSTILLKNMKERFTEHCFYTDAEFATYPVLYVNTISICHFPVYVYRKGREDQSVSKKGIRKYYPDQEVVFWNIVNFYNEKLARNILERKEIVLSTLVMLFYDWHKFRFYLPFSINRITEMRTFENNVSKICPEVIKQSEKKSRLVRILINSRYLVYPIIFLYYQIQELF